jgi:hypothetical protein
MPLAEQQHKSFIHNGKNAACAPGRIYSATKCSVKWYRKRLQETVNFDLLLSSNGECDKYTQDPFDHGFVTATGGAAGLFYR